MQALANDEAVSGGDDVVTVDGQETSSQGQQNQWTKLRGRSSKGVAGRRTPARRVLSDWLAGGSFYENYDVLVLWFDGLIDEDNNSSLFDGAGRPGGAWALIGEALPPPKGRATPSPIVVYVFARSSAIGWGRQVAADIQAASKDDGHLFAGTAPLELLPGAAPEISAALTWPVGQTATWTPAGAGQGEPLVSGATVVLPGRLTLGPASGPFEQLATHRARIDGGADLSALGATLSFNGAVMPAALPASWLPAPQDPEPLALAGDEPALDWGLDKGAIADLRTRVAFGAACPAERQPDGAFTFKWLVGEVLPCPIPLGGGAGKVVAASTCGRVLAGALDKELRALPMMAEPGAAGSCSSRIRYALKEAPRSGAEKVIVRRAVAAPLVSKVSMRGADDPRCAPPNRVYSDSLEVFRQEVEAQRAACPNQVWATFAGLSDDLLSRFFAAQFSAQGGGKVTKLRALERIARVAFELVSSSRNEWHRPRDLLEIELLPPVSK